MKLAGWGGFPIVEARCDAPRDEAELRAAVLAGQGVIARGNGRAYGDCAVNAAATLEMRHFTRMLSFDGETGMLVAEAGVILGDVIAALLPRGWFPPVTPGTKFVTLGGAIAADVHGKNHHRDGSFRACVEWIEVMGADGVVRRCSRNAEADLFDHTLGGMGLTGIILRAAIRLRRVETGYIRQRSVAARDLESALAVFEENHAARYSVAWIDCLATGRRLGRSLVLLGDHAAAGDLPPGLAQAPFGGRPRRGLTVPGILGRTGLARFALNGAALRGLNALHYHAGAWRAGERLVDWDRFFYPLDALRGWNRLYGPRGFVQFQCALPLARSAEGLAALLAETGKARQGSFLAVLKRFGPQEGAFSFPMAGHTLALDFPAGPATLALLERLDRITLEHGGRFYLAKDSRMSAATFHASDARIAAFRAARGDHRRFRSAQSERLGL